MSKDKIPKTITIIEDWVELEGTVFYRWKQPHEKEWHYRKTPYKEKPVVQFRYMTEEELGWLTEEKDIKDWTEL